MKLRDVKLLPEVTAESSPPAVLDAKDCYLLPLPGGLANT